MHKYSNHFFQIYPSGNFYSCLEIQLESLSAICAPNYAIFRAIDLGSNQEIRVSILLIDLSKAKIHFALLEQIKSVTLLDQVSKFVNTTAETPDDIDKFHMEAKKDYCNNLKKNVH